MTFYASNTAVAATAAAVFTSSCTDASVGSRLSSSRLETDNRLIVDF